MDVRDLENNSWMEFCYGANSSRIEHLLTEINNIAENKSVKVERVEDGYDPGAPEDPISRKQLIINYADGTKEVFTNGEIACLMGKNINERTKATRFLNALINDNKVYEWRVTKLHNNSRYGSESSEWVAVDKVGHLDTEKLRNLKYGGI